KFPRSHRFILGERIETAILTVLMLLVEAAYTRDKIPLLQRANLELEKLQFLVRLGRDLGFTSVKQYEHAAKELVGLGQQVGGWLRQQRGRA
ncbi:MAG: diversity-generating retroelement protein Avd, partial [Nitrospirota bacterium]